MENQEMEESYTSLPVLPRLDRLDRLVELLEEKHGLAGSWRGICKNEDNNKQEEEEEEEKCSMKTLSSVLDEVQHKGSLLERLSILENRVFQLTLDVDMEEDERNTSKSSSTVVVAAGGGSVSDTLSTGNSGEQEKEQIFCPLSIKEQDSKKACDLEELKKDHNSSGRQSNKKSYKKMLGWLRMGC